MNFLLTLGISLANNLDNLGAGIAIGVGRIKLPMLVNAWISVVTFILTGVAVLFGSRIGAVLPPLAAKSLSAILLCSIGVYVLAPALRKAKTASREGGVDEILSDAAKVDRDHNRRIDYKEGTLLGVALSINNIGGGVSAGLVHLSALWVATLSASFSFIVLFAGSWGAARLVGGRLATGAPVLAGSLLVLIGLLQFR